MTDLAAKVRSFRESAIRSVTFEGACSEPRIRAARTAILERDLDLFDLAHRGRYAFCDATPDEEVLANVLEIASACAGHNLRLSAHRVYCLRRGDYSLIHDDLTLVESLAPGSLDVSLDLSETATGEAEVVFTHRGQAFFTVPQRPGQLGIVERGPTVARYDRYLTHRVGDAVVVRLRLILERARA